MNPQQETAKLEWWEKRVGDQVVSIVKHLDGHPRTYRFDAKEGTFDVESAIVQSKMTELTFQPMAWRIFYDDILNMGHKNWAELFFIDKQACVSSILFHGFSVDNIYRLIEPLFYDDLLLSDIVVTVTAERRENTRITPKGVYYIAKFTYKLADTKKTQQLQRYAKTYNIYRQETVTDVAQVKTSFNFYNPLLNSTSSGTHTLIEGSPVVDEVPAVRETVTVLDEDPNDGLPF
ncbi:hypothetical protein [Larkinella sp. C7]|uniref:hypothetical protein n=1 Tax=Larkinella sp. C7 TaxID=2576607 RepID=UPI001BB18DD1|nr:hypothetical protein [Larkinella sp. C7]